MQPLIELIRGLDILNPFLTQYGFEFEKYENGQGSGGEFTVASFLNGHKKFIVNYRFSIGQVIYQHDFSTVCHDFYLDQLGLADKKKIPDFHSEDQLIAFRHLLHDFEFLVEDFFEGQCLKLREFSKLQDNIITGYGATAHEEYYLQSDKERIEEARQKFKNKNFERSIEIYQAIECKGLLNDLDNKIIEFCEHHRSELK